MRRMPVRQRTVIVIALGSCLAIFAAMAVRLLGEPSGGWFASAPNTGVLFSSNHDDSWTVVRAALVWLLATITWASASLYLLRPDQPIGGDQETR